MARQEGKAVDRAGLGVTVEYGEWILSVTNKSFITELRKKSCIQTIWNELLQIFQQLNLNLYWLLLVKEHFDCQN